jgi:hypothetical protein
MEELLDERVLQEASHCAILQWEGRMEIEVRKYGRA